MESLAVCACVAVRTCPGDQRWSRIAVDCYRCIYASDYASVSRRSPPLPSPSLAPRSPLRFVVHHHRRHHRHYHRHHQPSPPPPPPPLPLLAVAQRSPPWRSSRTCTSRFISLFVAMNDIYYRVRLQEGTCAPVRDSEGLPEVPAVMLRPREMEISQAFGAMR